jgi:hypothetical protein
VDAGEQKVRVVHGEVRRAGGVRRADGHRPSVHSDQGLAPRAWRDLEVGIATGHPDGDEAATSLAEMALRLLGVPADDGHEVARRPLPHVD